jgi:hypothetical protein
VQCINPHWIASNFHWDDQSKRVNWLTQINQSEVTMDEEALNMSIRKFLKKVGITSQREIERAIDQANTEGRLDGNPVRVKITLECDLIDDALSIEDEIRY